MLPGFRFLFAAILLSTSILVFGLGAAALLRATHEQAVNNPSWRPGPQDQMFAQTPEPPMLAVLRVEPLPADPAPTLRDQVPTIALPENEPEPAAKLGSAPVPPAEPQTFAPTGAVAEPPKAEPITFVPSEAPPAMPAPDTEDRPASPAAAASELQPADIASAPAETGVSVERVAALSDATAPAVKDSSAKAKADTRTNTKSDANAASESKATKKRAHRTKKRRIVRRAPPPVQQQSFDNPFAQQPAFAAATARTR